LHVQAAVERLGRKVKSFNDDFLGDLPRP